MEREKLRKVLAELGIATARRSLISNATEEVIVLTAHDYSRVDVEAVASAIAKVLPDKKITVIPDGDRWRSEPL